MFSYLCVEKKMVPFRAIKLALVLHYISIQGVSNVLSTPFMEM